MSDATELFYNTRVCPECGGHEKNCEHFWAGHAVGQKFAEARIIKLLEAEQLHDPDVLECHCGSWREAIALIKGEK